MNAEDNVSPLVPLEKADIRLVSGDSKTLFDISRSPLIDFHHYEREHQGISDQVGLFPVLLDISWQHLGHCHWFCKCNA